MGAHRDELLALGAALRAQPEDMHISLRGISLDRLRKLRVALSDMDSAIGRAISIAKKEAALQLPDEGE